MSRERHGPSLHLSWRDGRIQNFRAGRPDILPYLNVVTGLGAMDIWKSGHGCAMMACGYGTTDDHNDYGSASDSYREGFRDGRAYERRRDDRRDTGYYDRGDYRRRW